MKRIGKKVALLLAVVAMMGGYTYAEQTVDELQKNAWEKIVNNKAGELTAGERESILKTVAKFGLIDSIDRYVKLNSTYGQVIGGDNHAVDSNSIQGRAVYGGNHQYVSDAAATIGNDGNNFGSNAVAIGYQPTAFGENAIAMGTNSVAFPLRATQIGSSNAIGAAAWAGNLGNAYGAFAKAMGTGSIAIGVQSSAGVPDIKRYLLGGGKNQYEYQPYFSQLQEKYPDVFGAVNPAEDSSARSERIGKLIFEHYKAYFSSIKISSFDVLKERVTEWESVLQQLGWHMVLSKDGSDYTTALGFRSEATAAGGVALGAFSEADRGTVTVKAPFSEVTLTDQNTLGAVSVGNKTHGRQLINVADGTEDTDAVNLRQLKALNKKVDGKKDIHFFSSNGFDSDINYDNQGARAGFTTAIGPDAMATEENSQAFGFRAKAIGHSSIVFGVESTASGARDIAIGYGTHAVGSNNTITSWDDTIAIGFNALSRGGSFASGSGAVAGGSGSVALGAGAYVGTKWLDDETQKAQNVNKWVLTRSFLDKGLRDELKAKFPEKFAEWEQRAKSMPDAMGSDYLEQKLRTLAMEQLPQMTSPSMNSKMKDMGSSIAIGRGAKVYSAFAIAIGSEAKVGENLDDAIALGNQSLATRKAGGFGYDPTSDATTWTAFKKVHPEVGVGAAREQEITRELNNIEVEMKKMGNEYAAWIDKEQHYDNYKEERKAYAEAHGNILDTNNEWVEWVAHVRNEQQNLRKKGQVLYDKFSVLQKELNSGKGAWVGGKAALAIGNEEAGVTRQITGVAAGSEDTDAVNVAQLKVLNTKVDKVAANSTAYTVETKENNDNTTTVTIKSNKAGDKGTTVTVATKDIHITSGTYDKNTKKLTFKTNTNTTFDVDMNDVINAAAEGSVHYLSVKSSETGEGSNYKNDGATGKDAVAIGSGAQAQKDYSTALGNEAQAEGKFSTALGQGAQAEGDSSTALGVGTIAIGDSSTALGQHARAKGDSSTALGDTAYAKGDSSTALGQYTRAEGKYSTALGFSAKAQGEFSTALGVETIAKGDSSTALGRGAKAPVEGSVALGEGTVAGREAGTVGYVASDGGTTLEAVLTAMGKKADYDKWTAKVNPLKETYDNLTKAYFAADESDKDDVKDNLDKWKRDHADFIEALTEKSKLEATWRATKAAVSVGADGVDKAGNRIIESRQITNVAAGTKDTDAVNVAQLKAIENKIGTGGTNGKDGKSAYDIWLETQTDKTKTKQDFLDSLKGKDGKDGTGADIEIKGDTESGVSVKPTTDNAGKKTYIIGLGTKIKAGEVTIDGTKDKENAVVGDVKINGEKGKGTITGLSNKTWDVNKIVSGRAVTEDQLQQATQNMQNHIYEIGKHVNGIAASNAALAGLHPLEYDEDDKWNLSAAIGNYKGANAFALGAFYQPNERTMLSIGGTLAGEEHLLNVGLSLKTGPGTAGKVYVSRAAMAREIKALKEKDARRDEQLNQQKAEIKALKEKEAQRDEQIRKLTEMIVKLQRRA